MVTNTISNVKFLPLTVSDRISLQQRIRAHRIRRSHLRWWQMESREQTCLQIKTPPSRHKNQILPWEMKMKRPSDNSGYSERHCLDLAPLNDHFDFYFLKMALYKFLLRHGRAWKQKHWWAVGRFSCVLSFNCSANNSMRL